MPIYDYTCRTCNITSEEFMTFDEEDNVKCESCGVQMKRCVTLWANTPSRWGDSHGYFDRGLGTYVKSNVHRDKIMKERNIRPVSEQEIDEAQHESYSTHKQHEKDVVKFQSELAKHNDTTKAIDNTFATQEI